MRQPDEIDTYMSRLAYCESRGNEKAINQDDMGSPSYGLFQYKAGTWNYFSGLFGFEGDILNGDDQRTLTRMVLEHDIGNKSHWLNCSRMIEKRSLANM